MGSVKKLANEIQQGFERLYPAIPEVIKRNLPLIVAAQMEARTANTAVLACFLPLETMRPELRDQWLRRQLSKKALNSIRMVKPFVTQFLHEATKCGQVIQLSMDQTDIADRFAVLTIALRIGDRALPLAWAVESGPANIGFERQKELLEQVLVLVPANTQVMLCADRFYPSEELFKWLKQHGWKYRIRLKSNFLVDIGSEDLLTTGALAQGYQERYEVNVLLFQAKVMTNIGILHEPGHEEPWIIAMDCRPNRATVLDYASRWCIEPMFSDFKTNGFGLEDTRIQNPARLHNLILIMALAMYWCIHVGRNDALNNKTPLEKKSLQHAGTNHWSVRKVHRSLLSWFQRGLRILIQIGQNSSFVPAFAPCVMRL